MEIIYVFLYIENKYKICITSITIYLKTLFYIYIFHSYSLGKKKNLSGLAFH